MRGPRSRMMAAVLGAFVVTACDSGDQRDAPAEIQETAEETPQILPISHEDELARPDPHWVESRVEDARERLHLEEVGARVWEAIEAHGGLMTYFSAGPLSYRWVAPGGEVEHLVDTWSGRAVLRRADAESPTWWSDEESGEPPYFVTALPFLLSDPGVELEDGEGGEVLARFGWSRDQEFYGIFLDEETGLISRVRTGGGEVLAIQEYREVGGLRLAGRISRESQGDEVVVQGYEVRPQEPLSTFSEP